jgi:hypothetical protein
MPESGLCDLGGGFARVYNPVYIAGAQRLTGLIGALGLNVAERGGFPHAFQKNVAGQ